MRRILTALFLFLAIQANAQNPLWGGKTAAQGATFLSSALSYLFPDTTGLTGYVFGIKAGGGLGWITTGAGSVTSVGLSGNNGISILNSPIISSGIITVGITNGSIGDSSLASTFLKTAVTSVGATATNGLTVSGSPITTTGTFAFGIANGSIGDSSLASTFLKGNQSITLSGDVSGSGATSITTAIGSQKVTTAMLKDTNVTYLKLQHNSLSNYLLGSTTAYHDVQPIKLGTNLSMSNDTLNASGSSGTVTSVGLSGGTTGLTVSGSPITTSGTITLAGTLAIGNGGTNATTANAGLNNLLPSQTGNSGKFLTTNGTNTSWGTAGGSSAPQAPVMYFSENFVGTATSSTALNSRWSAVISSGSYNSSVSSNGLEIHVNGSGGYSYGYLNPSQYISSNRKAIFTSAFYGSGIYDAGSTAADIYVGLGRCTSSASGIDYTGGHIGFKMVRTGASAYSIYITIGDGSSETTSTLLTTSGDGNIELCCRWNSGTSADFWYSKNGAAWSSATNITTGLPSLLNFGMSFSMADNGNANGYDVIIPYMSLMEY